MASKINQINCNFYQDRAEEFSLTRKNGWPGWERFWKTTASKLPNNPKILDIGCGNGRFAGFINKKLANNYSYTGIDQSKAMLKIAEKKFSKIPQIKFVKSEAETYQIKDFSMITAFGLWHHLFGYKKRMKLLNNMIEGTVNNGVIAISIWRAERIDSLLNKAATADEITQMGINLPDLDQGDKFLPFGSDRKKFRYVHLISSEEIENLKFTNGMNLIDTYDSDGHSGRLNTYLIWQKLPPK